MSTKNHQRRHEKAEALILLLPTQHSISLSLYLSLSLSLNLGTQNHLTTLARRRPHTQRTQRDAGLQRPEEQPSLFQPDTPSLNFQQPVFTLAAAAEST